MKKKKKNKTKKKIHKEGKCHDMNHIIIPYFQGHTTDEFTQKYKDLKFKLIV